MGKDSRWMNALMSGSSFFGFPSDILSHLASAWIWVCLSSCFQVEAKTESSLKQVGETKLF